MLSIMPKSPKSPRKQGVPSCVSAAELEAPLDYSFYNMTSVTDVDSWDPRQGYAPPHKTVLDTEVPDNEARVGVKGNPLLAKKPNPSAKHKLSRSKCFKLNNNSLPQASEIKTVAEKLFEDCNDIRWIDLSFNELTKIDDVLLDFPNLQILYLHGNQFSDLSEIEKLAKISTLKKLSVHGNPIENEKGYKYMIIAMLPQLETLDFSRITNGDRRTAATLRGMNKNNRKGKRKSKKSDE